MKIKLNQYPSLIPLNECKLNYKQLTNEQKMTMNTSRMVLAEAQAAHGGDRAALLAAIDEAAASITLKPTGGFKPAGVASQGPAMMKSAKVNTHVARDLVSNAGSSRVGDMGDFAVNRRETPAGVVQFEHSKTLLNNRSGVQTQSRQVEEDLRSLKSEYDYGSKKKFVDVLGNVSISAKLQRMRVLHQIEKAQGNGVQVGAGSLMKESSNSRVASYKTYSKSNKSSRYSRQTGCSLSNQQIAMMNQNQTAPITTPIAEEAWEQELEFEANPEDFDSCNNCRRELGEDEKIINARFVNEAISRERDISMFPVCISCNMERLEQTQMQANQRSAKFTHPKEGKGVFFNSNKKLYETNMFQNSEDFKQLGTMHLENRASDYFPMEKPQPKSIAQSPLASIPMESQVKFQIGNRKSHGLTAFDHGVNDPEHKRSAHIKNLVADRRQEDQMRKQLVQDEIVKTIPQRGSSAQRRRTEVLFPTTTNQETHNDDVHARRPMEIENHRKKSPFMTFVNSSFNAGVFINPCMSDKQQTGI